MLSTTAAVCVCCSYICLIRITWAKSWFRMLDPQRGNSQYLKWHCYHPPLCLVSP